MSIHMPTYTQLSDEQKAILEESDYDDNILVVGPPGTGKTVIAMHRAEGLARARKQTVNLIMYNKVLEHYTSQWDSAVFRESVAVSTYHKWVATLWRHHKCGGNAPHTEPYNYDWPVIQAEFVRRKVQLGRLVIDEAQDLPVSFYKALGLIAGSCNGQSSFCIVADENQRLDENHNSSINDIRKAIILAGEPQEYLLHCNYRNTYEIALLASRFYVGLDSGTAELPETRRGQKPRMVGYDKGTNGMADAISRHASNNPTHSVLVVCPTSRLVKSLRNKVEARLSGRNVKAFLSGKKSHVASDLETGLDGSVTLLHWRSMKGVEADAVFVPHLEAFDLGGDSTVGEKMRLYVLLSRARQILELQYDHSDKSVSETRLIEAIRETAGDDLEELEL